MALARVSPLMYFHGQVRQVPEGRGVFPEEFPHPGRSAEEFHPFPAVMCGTVPLMLYVLTLRNAKSNHISSWLKDTWGIPFNFSLAVAH